MENSEENLMASMSNEELEDHVSNTKKFDELEYQKILPSYYSWEAILLCAFFWPLLFSAILFATNLKNQRDKWIVIGSGIMFTIFIVTMYANFEMNDRFYFYSKGFVCVMLVGLGWFKFIGESTRYVKKARWLPLVIAVAFFALSWYLRSLYPEAFVLFLI